MARESSTPELAPLCRADDMVRLRVGDVLFETSDEASHRNDTRFAVAHSACVEPTRNALNSYALSSYVLNADATNGDSIGRGAIRGDRRKIGQCSEGRRYPR